MIGWIPTKHLSTVSQLSASQRRHLWWSLYWRTLFDLRAATTLLVLLVAVVGGIWSVSWLTLILFVVSFWLHWAVCGHIAYPRFEQALHASGLLSPPSERNHKD